MFTLNSLRAWTRRRSGKRILTIYLVILVALFGGAFILGPWLGLMPGATGDAGDTPGPVADATSISGAATTDNHGFHGFFTPFTSDHYSLTERLALVAVVLVAVAGLAYAGLLARQVLRADKGTAKMQEIATAVREGANAYLAAQFRRIGPLIILITLVLFLTKWGAWAFAFGRA